MHVRKLYGLKESCVMWRKFLPFLIFLHHMWIYSFDSNWYWDACCSQIMAIQILKWRTSMKHHIFWALKLNETRWIKILVSPKKNILTRKYYMVDCLSGRFPYHNFHIFFFWNSQQNKIWLTIFSKGLSFVLLKAHELRTRPC